jgi:outer membrane protein assembly factor BamB
MPVFTRDDERVLVSTGRAVRAFRITDGHQLWRTQFTSEMGPPAVAPDGTVVVGDSAGDVRGLLPRTGAPAWTTALSFPVTQPAAFGDGGHVYVPNGSRLSAMNTAGGGILWNRNLQGTANAPSVGADGSVYVGGGTDFARFRSDGSQIWTHTVPFGTGSISLHPNGMIFLGTPTGTLTIMQSPVARKSLRRRVPIGNISGTTIEQLLNLTTERDGRPVVIRGARNATVPGAFARMWAADAPIEITFGANQGRARRVLAATVRAYVRVTHGSTVTQRLHTNNGPMKLLDTRILSPGWNLLVMRFEGDAAREVAVGNGSAPSVVLTWEGSGDVSGSSVEVDLLEVGHEYSFLAELQFP